MDGSQSTMIAALEGQAARLKRLSLRLDACRSTLGRPGDGIGETIWRGPAHSAWLGAVDALRVQVAEAHGVVQNAEENSRRAIATLAGRG